MGAITGPIQKIDEALDSRHNDNHLHLILGDGHDYNFVTSKAL